MNSLVFNKYVILKEHSTQFGCPFPSYELAMSTLKKYKDTGIIKSSEAKLYKIAKIEVKILECFEN